MTQAARRGHYPTKAVVERMLSVARANGLDVVGFEVSPEGVVRVLDKRAIPAAPANDFDRWESQL